MTVNGPGRRELTSVHCHVPIRNFIDEKSGFEGVGTGVPSTFALAANAVTPGTASPSRMPRINNFFK